MYITCIYPCLQYIVYAAELEQSLEDMFTWFHISTSQYYMFELGMELVAAHTF